ncbi:MAG: carbohydrate-binding protein, partial [Chitinivibrionales bacterium]
PEKAVALLNRNTIQEDITVEFSDIGVPDGDSVFVRDLWAHEDKGLFTDSYTASVASHGTAMLKISKIPDLRSAFSVIEAESYYNQSGVQREDCSEGGEYIGYIEDGDYAVYKPLDFESGAAEFEVRAASGEVGGSIEIRLDSLNGYLAGTCEIQETGDWQSWNTFTCSISNIQGEHDLYLRFTGGEGYLFNLNWFQFISESVATGKRYIKKYSRGYRINMKDGKIDVLSKSNYNRFSVSVFMPNGRLLCRKENTGSGISIPVKSRGIYLIKIRSNGRVEKKRVFVF